jgi:hypothetical protein
VNYSTIYAALIARGRARELASYTERHHVVPRCLGGSDDQANLVRLTPEEHFVAHALLVKIHPEERGLVLALSKMCSPVGERPKRKLYGWMRRRFAEAISAQQMGSNNSQYGKKWITDGAQSIKIDKTEIIPDGWRAGRHQTCNGVLRGRVTSCTVCAQPTGSRRRKFCDIHFAEHKSELGRANAPKANASYAGKMFITNGTIDRLHPRDLGIPEGFRKGRSTNNHRPHPPTMLP